MSLHIMLVKIRHCRAGKVSVSNVEMMNSAKRSDKNHQEVPSLNGDLHPLFFQLQHVNFICSPAIHKSEKLEIREVFRKHPECTDRKT